MRDTMKAVVCTRYGSPDVLKLKEVEKPDPGEQEVLIRVHAASVTAADTMMREGSPFYGRLFLGLTKPKNPIPGTGFAGVVEKVGNDTTRFDVGDAVFGETAVKFGTNAEYVCLPEDGLIAPLPDSMSFEEAAPVCDGALTSLSFLKDIGNLQRGQHVLINGASGSLGTAAIQLAKHFGTTAAGVCSTPNLEMVRNLGADEVIDYTKQDFTQSDKKFDLIFDTVGKSSFSQCQDILTEHGRYLSPVLGLPLLLQMMRTSIVGKKKALFSATGMREVPELRGLINKLTELIEAEQLISVMDRSYPLEETAEAHRYVDTSHKRGNVVVTMHP